MLTLGRFGVKSKNERQVPGNNPYTSIKKGKKMKKTSEKILKEHTVAATEAAIRLFHKKNQKKTADNVEFQNGRITVCEINEQRTETRSHCENFTWKEIADEVNRHAESHEIL